MYAAYGGGTSYRTLEQDDIDGVCSLYPGSCNCSSDGDCGPDEVCNGGTCEVPPCQNDSDCPSGKVCNSGTCAVPSCSSDSDCDSGFYCDQNTSTCEPECPVCQPCSQSSDCGSNGYCVEFSGGNNKCVVTCGQGGTCPGDSECFPVSSSGSSQTYYLCLNPNAGDESVGSCPDSYTCTEDGGSSSGGSCSRPRTQVTGKRPPGL